MISNLCKFVKKLTKMKNLFIPLLFITALLISSFTTPHTNDVKVNTENSKLIWTGSKPTGSHTGTIDIVSGFLTFDHGNFVGGNFAIDMNTILCTDIESESKNNYFVSHLKDEDFFNVEKFSDADLKITKVFKIDQRNYSVLADLTIKGITKPIAFDAEVTGNGNSFVAKSKFKIDRTKWGIEYKSGNIFKNLGDKIIYDDIEFDVFLISNK
jgi:polyisoprenoid-binding protein YceI|tara:strand:+ start:7311 stop:7946 length:636 start_codon:yes stop_codon:yes gene_type:complete